MQSLGVFITFGVALGGVAAVAVGVLMARKPAVDVGQYFHDLDADMPEAVDEFERKMSEPFFVRVVRPLSGTALGLITRLTPRNYLDSTHKKILLAGMASKMRAEEFVVGQAASTGV